MIGGGGGGGGVALLPNQSANYNEQCEVYRDCLSATRSGLVLWAPHCDNYSRASRRKKRIVRNPSPSVNPTARLSVSPSIRPSAIPLNHSYTIDARFIKPFCMIPLCTQILEKYSIYTIRPVLKSNI